MVDQELKPNQHGGQREGSGRKKLNRVQISIQLPLWQVVMLRRIFKRRTGGMSAFIERAVSTQIQIEGLFENK